ncbi:YceI family protein [Saccharothrix algeriensis]|uniref:Polyisoprenoid-binding protein YceI n=1 Tax=Saccharothrix algeriensis TaxID=173560 RepID=A0A8T8HZ60_9PSEU|nr:YceI family protein [Saccharothrix algeriensis]MBM7809438.1 polyisoprenoid-binding protein YceI [Saccharothrix algeriensis]QTR03776.1 YceI family protein [Saccharothrix algeriensis]
MTTQHVQIPGYLAGTWAIDPVHSDVSFVVRHLGVSKVRGHFDTFEGTIVTAENPLESTVTAKIATASINTKNAQRDAHVKNEDFLDVDKHPELTFTSTGVRAHGEGFLVDGELTLRGVTKPVTLELELNGFGDGMGGGKVAGFSASTEISRKDFGVTGGPAGAAVGDKITILLEIEASQQS